MSVSQAFVPQPSSLQSTLAIHGGDRTVPALRAELFHWPIVTEEDERAVIQVLREGKMSGTDISREFEREWGEYAGTQFNLAHCNGTCALYAAMFGVGLGRGDEIIGPSLTYWASMIQAYSLGATMVFADIDPVTLCLDPGDIEHRITPRTKAIMVVHYCGHPADMDPIMEIARRRNLKVIEDGSHAHGALYKGRKVGTLGDVAGFSMMSAKGLPIGEGGMLSTNDRTIFERAIALGHYERCETDLTDPAIKALIGLPSAMPAGGIKARINQTCSAMGRVQLKHFPERMGQVQRALNRFWDLLEGVPGLRAHRVAKGSGSTMGGWYNPLAHYVPEELGGLPVEKFHAAVIAEGGRSGGGANVPIHLHALANESDIYGDGKPTRLAFARRDVRQGKGSLPVSERLAARSLGVPSFKHDDAEEIALYAEAYRKVALNARRLL